MLSVKNEQDIKGFHECWVRLVVFVSESVEHVEEVLNVPSIGRSVVFSSNSVPEGVGSDRWGNSKDSVKLLISLFLILKNYVIVLPYRYSARRELD
jgi:hypothetical protein